MLLWENQACINAGRKLELELADTLHDLHSQRTCLLASSSSSMMDFVVLKLSVHKHHDQNLGDFAKSGMLMGMWGGHGMDESKRQRADAQATKSTEQA